MIDSGKQKQIPLINQSYANIFQTDQKKCFYFNESIQSSFYYANIQTDQKNVFILTNQSNQVFILTNHHSF